MLAEPLQWRSTFLPRRFQTANAFDTTAGPDLRQGAAWLIQSSHGIPGRMMTNVGTAGDPYTFLIAIFDNAAACEDGCDENYLGNPHIRGSVYYGTAAISADNGKGGGVFNVDFNVVAGNIPNDLFILFGDPNGLHRGNGFNAEVHLVVDKHEPITPGMDPWIPALTSTNFPGTGPAVNSIAAVFVPCPDSHCPESAL